MGKVVFEDPIHHISGKIAKKFRTIYNYMKALTKIVADQQAFLAQKDTAGGAKTMRAYLWRVCGQEYDQQHGS